MEGLLPSDLVSVGRQSHYKTDGSNENDPDGGIGPLREEALLVDLPDSCQGTSHVSNLTSAVGKNDAAGREYLQQQMAVTFLCQRQTIAAANELPVKSTDFGDFRVYDNSDSSCSNSISITQVAG